MYSGKIYTEDQFKTLLSCSKLYALEGSIENFDISQSFVKQSLAFLILELVNFNNSFSLDSLINVCVNKAYVKVYGRGFHNDASEIVRLKSYAFNFINYFILKINLKKCDILLGPTFPVVSCSDFSLRLSLDAIFKPKDRKKQLHAVCFYPFINEHLLSNDPTIWFKLNYLNKFAHSSINKNKFSEVNLHIFSVSKFDKYKSKARENKIYYKHITPNSVDASTLQSFSSSIRFAVENPTPNIYCYNLKCEKRKDCFHGTRRI